TFPAVPNLTAPLDKAIVVSVRPNLTWGAVAAVANYRIDIDVDDDNNGTCDFAGNVVDNVLVAAVPTTVSYMPPALAQGSYCWRVRAVDAAGNTTPSASRSFSVFIGTAPANGAFAPAGKPAFQWGAVVGATGYELQVSNDTTFAVP